MSLYELYATRTYAKDANNRRVASRVFRAPAARTAAQAQAMFDADPLNRTFPDDSSLVFDRTEVSPAAGGDEMQVTAFYSSFRAGRLQVQQPNRDAAGYFSFGWDKRRVQQRIVLNVREWRSPVDDEPPYQVWRPSEMIVTEYRTQRTAKVRVQTQDVRIFDAISLQIGKLHTIGNTQPVQFVDGSVTEGDGTYYDVEYTWEIDYGTLMPEPREVPNRFAVALPTDGTPRIDFYRLPFEVAGDPISPQDPRTELFTVPFVEVDQSDPLGWQTLPGTEVL